MGAEGLLGLMETNPLLSQKGKLRRWEDKGFLEVTKGRLDLLKSEGGSGLLAPGPVALKSKPTANLFLSD